MFKELTCQVEKYTDIRKQVSSRVVGFWRNVFNLNGSTTNGEKSVIEVRTDWVGIEYTVEPRGDGSESLGCVGNRRATMYLAHICLDNRCLDLNGPGCDLFCREADSFREVRFGDDEVLVEKCKSEVRMLLHNQGGR